jgi:hypothetical protein
LLSWMVLFVLKLDTQNGLLVAVEFTARLFGVPMSVLWLSKIVSSSKRKSNNVWFWEIKLALNFESCLL